LISLPVDISTEGWRLDRALSIAHVFVGALTAIAIVWLLVAVVRGRRREHAEFFRGTSRRAALLPLLIAGFVFFVVDGQLFWRSTRDMHGTFNDFSRPRDAADTLRVQLNARQWAWDVRYPGLDGRFGTADDIYATGDLYIPKGRPVWVQLASVDVVHALVIPNLRVQRDAIPGRVAQLWFEAQKAGSFDVICGQHCGVNHYRMSARLHVLDADAFDAWLDRESGYAEKIAKASAELEGEPETPTSFPDFARDPDIKPRAWGWPWQGGLD